MAGVVAKRKAPASRSQPEKRQRIEHAEDEDDDGDHDFNLHEDESSENEQTVDTPITPFSPGRKRFASELKTIKCTYEGCDKTFNRPARLTAHLKTHTGERTFVCTYEGCDKAYFQDKHLQAHIKGSHTHERAYKCDWEGCDKSFLTSTRLKRHKDTHIGHERFRCTAYPPCNQTFRKHQTLQRHINSEHLQLAPYQCPYVDPITLEKCPAGYDGANGLRQHVDRVHGAAQFFCPDCVVPGRFNMDGTPMHLGFVTEKEFQAHVRKEHANCPFCDIKCRSERELQKHVDTMHSGTTVEERKIIPCTFAGCDKKFTKKNNLNTHIRTAHMGERYICGTFDVSAYPDVAIFKLSDGCGNDFSSKHALVDHTRTAHLGLPTVTNAYKKKAPASKVEPDDDTDDDDEYMNEDIINDEEYVEPKKKAKKRGAKTKTSAVEDLLGLSYNNDPKRNIICPVLDCPYRFMRDYDLQVHMRTAHQAWTQNMNSIFPSHANHLQYPEPSIDSFATTPTFVTTPTGNDAGALMDTYAQAEAADFNWELQRQALEGGAFWVGADERVFDGGPDQEWNQDAEEMRRLIG